MSNDVLFAFSIAFCFVLAFFVISFLIRAFLSSRCKHQWNTFTTIHYFNGEKCWDEIGQCCDVCGKVKYVKVKLK